MIGLRVAHLVSSLSPNGATSCAINLMRWLRANDHDTIVLSTGGDREVNLEEAGIDLIRYEPGGAGWLLAGRRRLTKALAEWKPDLLHVHRLDCLNQGLALASKLSLPLVVSVHAWVEGNDAEILRDPGVGLVLVPTEAQRSWYCTRGGLNRDRVAVLPYGLELERFGTQPKEGPVSIIGALGNFSEKAAGWNDTIAAIEELRAEYANLTGLLIGRGQGREELSAQLVKSELDEVIALEDAGPVIAPALERMDIFAYPVTKDSHSLGLLKAMASGCAVVASAVGGVPELIQDGVSGLLVPSGDRAAFVAALRSLLADPELARELGRNARATVETEHDIDMVGAVVHELYRCALRGGTLGTSGTETVTTWRRVTTGSQPRADGAA
ncbi:MAG: glycosyltransferase family 4 protein [Planctomycetota bacterium]|jgi:glycosyltransferase involved in cell wall biosynthesis|nr:glycosyltransferase family 4 protein [Planctomycetota bacterium]